MINKQPSWLSDAVFYEIYPQSFYDTNGDGIGDLRGIIEKLDYVKSIGCNALWINPCFDSPFVDAGYDVRDYKKIAPRYGTNDDMRELLSVAHEKGIRVLLDLVPGHTSEEHPYFLESAKETQNEMSDRYIWTDEAFTGAGGLTAISGVHPRNGSYITNFFKCQPALNFGFGEPTLSWHKSYNSPEAIATREMIKDIMRFWLSMGCDGFRVDMASSLVKKDTEDRSCTKEVWRDIIGDIKSEYPEMALVSEWGCPEQALDCGFDMDFCLQWCPCYGPLMRDYKRDNEGRVVSQDNSYFKSTSNRDALFFKDDYVPRYEKTKDKGLWCFITCNHDATRPAPMLDETERRLAFAFIFTMPGAPFLYYGDEIGMSFRWLPTKEGGYRRTGSRTPMQWKKGENLGFSTAAPEKLYLSVDPSDNAPTVAEQEKDPDSFLNFVRSVISLRKEHKDLGNNGSFSMYFAKEGYRTMAYKRGNVLLAVNPGNENETLPLDTQYKSVYSIGKHQVNDGELVLQGQSFVVLVPVK